MSFYTFCHGSWKFYLVGIFPLPFSKWCKNSVQQKTAVQQCKNEKSHKQKTSQNKKYEKYEENEEEEKRSNDNE